jgi:hypothetical protein
MSIDNVTPEEWNAAYRSVHRNTKEPDPTDVQIGGDHYADRAIQPIDFIAANGLDFMEGNIIKYITRHKERNGKEDILKAIHYCRLLLKYRYDDG